MGNLDARIKEHRSTEVTLVVTKEDNSPLTGQEIEVAQLNHRFLFGSNGHFLVPLVNNELTGAQKERNEDYRTFLKPGIT